MAISGARWGLQGAEAILTLRAVIANGDYDDYYWRYHLAREPSGSTPALPKASTHSGPDPSLQTSRTVCHERRREPARE